MSILKLDVGKPLTLAVDDAKIVEGKFGKQAAFHAGDDVFFMSLDTASRQLDRLGLSLTNAAGNTLHFEKITKGGKTFINIDFADNGRTAGAAPAASPAPQAKPTPAAAASPAPLSGHALYAKVAEWYCAEIIPLLRKHGIEPTHEGTGAGIAALFIEANKNR